MPSARVVSTQDMFSFVILILLMKDQYVIALNLYDCENLSKLTFCPPFDSYQWKYRAFCKNCTDGTKYHCCKDYDSPKSNCEQDEYYCQNETYVDGCAEEMFCKQGEEPVLSFIKNQIRTDKPEVFCVLCYNSNRYNSFVKSSAEYSECKKKLNICTQSNHKIECGKQSDEASDRFCRCDVINGYSPFQRPNDHPSDGCSFTNFDCRNYALKCKPDQQVLLNYTCGPACKKGFYRKENSDECLPNPTTERKELSKTSSTSTSYTDESTTRTDMTTERTTRLTSVRSKTLSPSIDDGEHPYKVTYLIPSVVAILIAVIAVITLIILWKKGYFKKRKESEEQAEQTSQTVNQDQGTSSTASPQEDESESEPDAETSLIYPPSPMYSSLNDGEKREFVTKVLNACHVAMIEDLDAKPVLDWFKGRNIFTKAKRRDIMDEKITSDRNRKLLERIQENGINCYIQFKDALKRSKQNNCITILDEQEPIVRNDLLNKRTRYAHSNSDLSDDEATETGE